MTNKKIPPPPLFFFIKYIHVHLLLQDLCQLVNADQPYWLIGMTEMTRTFGLELLESVLTVFPTIFSQVIAHIFLFRGNITSRN